MTAFDTTDLLPAPASPTDKERRKKPIRFGFNLPGVLFVVFVILLWQLLKATNVISSYYIPAPSAIWTEGVTMARDGELWEPIAHTVTAAVSGWAIASAIGLVLGLLMGSAPGVFRWSMASFDVIRAIPAVTFVPVIALIFGISLRAEIIVVIYVSAWPVLFNALSGIQGMRAGYRDTARTLRMTRSSLIRKVVLPAAAPDILVGLRLSMGLALTLAVVGELLINPAGLGFRLVQAQQRIQPESMYVIVIIIGILGFVLNGLLILLARVEIGRAHV